MSERRRLPDRREHEVIAFEHDGIGYAAGIGRFDDGAIAEIFLNTSKPGSQAETGARDAAICASLALQFGAPLDTIKKALARLSNGTAAGPLGRALDLAEGRAP